MSDLMSNVNQAILDLQSIKNAIVEKGVEVPIGTPTSEYAELIKTIKSENEFGVDFSTHNIFSESTDNWWGVSGVSSSAIKDIEINGEDVIVTIKGDLYADWYLMAHSLSLKAKTLYKFHVEGYTGYGRIGLSSFSNGASTPYRNENRNAIVISKNNVQPDTNDNHLANKNDISDKYLYICPDGEFGAEIRCAFWYCSDENRDDTSEFSFKIGLYEQQEED